MRREAKEREESSDDIGDRVNTREDNDEGDLVPSKLSKQKKSNKSATKSAKP